MPYAHVNDLELYYETEGSGHPLILISGYTSDLTSWDFVRPLLSKHFQIIVMDNRGAGRTKWPDTQFTVGQMAEDVISLSRHLGLEKPHIMGHSMGGMIAQTIAHKYPGRIGKAIFSETAIKLPPISVAVMDVTYELREQGLSSKMLTKIFMPWTLSNQFLSNQTLCEKFIERRELLKYPITLNGQKRQLYALKHFNSSAWYHEIKTPCLMMCGDEDLTCPPNDSFLLEKGIRGSKIHVFKQLGHMAPLERVEELCTLVLDFLGSCGSSSCK